MTKYNEELYRGERHWKEGEFDVFRSTHWSAPGCHNGCGLVYYVKDGVLDHVEGDPRLQPGAPVHPLPESTRGDLREGPRRSPHAPRPRQAR